MHNIDFNEYATRIHKLNSKWWHDLVTGERLDRNKGELLMLVITELAEGVEGLRKSLMDDHLPTRKMIEVELADAMIRLFDFAGGFDYSLGEEQYIAFTETNEAEIILNICGSVVQTYNEVFAEMDDFWICESLTFTLSYILTYAKRFGYDVIGAMEEKLAYNQKRADHKPENRLKENGKKF